MLRSEGVHCLQCLWTSALDIQCLNCHKNSQKIQCKLFALRNAADATHGRRIPNQRRMPADCHMVYAVVQVVENQVQTVFARAVYTMATSDAERIGVNAAANVTPSGGASESALAQHCSSLHSALQMLSERVQIIHAFCKEMQDGNAPIDHQVCCLVACWPACSDAVQLPNQVLFVCSHSATLWCSSSGAHASERWTHQNVVHCRAHITLLGTARLAMGIACDCCAILATVAAMTVLVLIRFPLLACSAQNVLQNNEVEPLSCVYRVHRACS
jgi:hypothetical protein